MEKSFEYVADEAEALIHPVRKCLEGKIISVLIDDEARQGIAFTMHYADRIYARVEFCSEREGGFYSSLKKLEIDFLLLASEQPNGDEGVWVVETQAQKLSAMITQLDDIARLRLAADFLNLVAESPEVAARDTTVFVFFERDDLIHDFRSRNRENPKSEYRKPKQARIPKIPITKQEEYIRETISIL